MQSYPITIRRMSHAWLGLVGWLCVVPAVWAGTGNYLIVTAQDYAGSAPLTQFVNHKTALGFTVSVYTAPAGTSASAIKAYIRTLWGTPNAPRYILLVGDTDGTNATPSTVPGWTGGGTKQAPTDLPYGCMDAGDDWIPEIAVGRFSVRTVPMLQAVVDKTITVETGDFPDPSYAYRAAFLATEDSDAQAEQTHEWVISNYLLPAGVEPIRIYAAQGGSTQQVADAVNLGCLFVNYFGHSSSNGWWSPSFNQDNVNALLNDGLYGLAFGFSCSTASYTSTECFGETWQRVPHKGAAAYISASTFIYYGGTAWESSRRLEKYFWQSFFVDHIWEVGPAWRAALGRLLADPTFSLEIKRNIFEMFVLLGDPALLLPETIPSPNPRVRVVTPNGGELLTIGQPCDISWVAYDDVAVTTIDILLSKDSGATFPTTIATGLANNGLYRWTVTPGASPHARIKVVAHDADGNTGEDSSDGDLTITSDGPRLLYDFPLDTNPGWTISGGQWAWGTPLGGGGEHGNPDPTRGHTGNNVYGYNLSGDYANGLPEHHLTTTVLDCSSATHTTLKFWRWLGVEQSNFDHAYVRVSNNGATWVTVWQNSASVTDGSWTQCVYDISAVADNHATVYVRWTMGTTDSMWVFCGWNIDDVQIWGILPAQPLLGDLNCDEAVNFGDINPFVLALTGQVAYEAAYPECRWLNADCDGDGSVSFADINPFVALLTGGK